MSESEVIKIREFQLLIEEDIKPRDYPWRNTSDTYRVLISEFMLHRTRAEQVVPVYKDFIKKYPTINVFLAEQEEIIERKLKTLGLFWRIKGMIHAIKELNTRYGVIPADYEKLIEIKGIGPYIAGAVVCFAGNQPVPLVDTNTVRVIGRVFGLDLTGEARRRKEVIETINKTTPEENTKRYYYCIIDLAHDVCHIKTPACEICPLKNICCFFKHKETPNEIPEKGR